MQQVATDRTQLLLWFNGHHHLVIDHCTYLATSVSMIAIWRHPLQHAAQLPCKRMTDFVVPQQDAASEGYATSDEEDASEDEQQAATAGSDDDIDMEDLGGRVQSGNSASASQAAPAAGMAGTDPQGPREMLTPALRANLGKQGYKLIGELLATDPVGSDTWHIIPVLVFQIPSHVLPSAQRLHRLPASNCSHFMLCWATADLPDQLIDGMMADTGKPGAHQSPRKFHLCRQVGEGDCVVLPGSHSGVKLCRWTKSMLRGRGGCYKHSFYGIESHRCMETTPSLACANKCVFCWRHHTNPGTALVLPLLPVCPVSLR